jgi:hypothetical protein
MDSQLYQAHATTIVKEVMPPDTVNSLVNIFLIDAAKMMGSSYSADTLEFAIEMVKHEFGYLPVMYIATAFKRGSLGKLGPGRLVGATIHKWLTEISNEYQSRKISETVNEELTYKKDFADLLKSPLGSAINTKIEWYKTGKLPIEEWDKVDMKELAEMLEKKLAVSPSFFGVKKYAYTVY